MEETQPQQQAFDVLLTLFMTVWGWRLGFGCSMALLGETGKERGAKVFLFILSDWKPQVFARKAHSLVSGKLSGGPLWFLTLTQTKLFVFEIYSHPVN